MIRALLALVVALVLTACARPPVQHPTPGEAATAYKATVLVLVARVEDGNFGTGWFLDDGLVVTAGHVCKPGVVTLELHDGAEVPAEVLARADEPDLCFLKTEARAPKKLPLARSSQTYFGDHVWWVGFPLGYRVLGEGRVSGPDDDVDRLVVGTTSWKGASGAALLNDAGQVLGVLTEMGTPNGSVILFVPVEDIYEFASDIN